MTIETSSRPLEILLIGLGSLGSIYSYCLERAGAARVTAVARSNYKLYTTTGVTLRTQRYGVIENWRPHRVVKSQAEALEGDVTYDFCLITTKCLPDINPTPKLVQEVINSDKVKAFALIQNGLDVERDLYEAVKDKDMPIISCAAWIGVMTSPDGSIVSWSGTISTTAMGIYPPSESPSASETKALQALYGAWQKADQRSFAVENISAVRFNKNIWNCVWSSIQGLTRTTNEVFGALDPSVQKHFRAFIDEVVQVGFKSGLLKEGSISYPSGEKMGDAKSVAEHAWTPVDLALSQISKGLHPHKMSLQIDVAMGRPFEVEVITGAVLKLAEEHGIDTPRLAMLYAMLKGLQADLIHKQSARA